MGGGVAGARQVAARPPRGGTVEAGARLRQARVQRLRPQRRRLPAARVGGERLPPPPPHLGRRSHLRQGAARRLRRRVIGRTRRRRRHLCAPPRAAARGDARARPRDRGAVARRAAHPPHDVHLQPGGQPVPRLQGERPAAIALPRARRPFGRYRRDPPARDDTRRLPTPQRSRRLRLRRRRPRPRPPPALVEQGKGRNALSDDRGDCGAARPHGQRRRVDVGPAACDRLAAAPPSATLAARPPLGRARLRRFGAPSSPRRADAASTSSPPPPPPPSPPP